MGKTLKVAGLVGGLLLAGIASTGMARADEDDCTVPMANWHPKAAVHELALAQGWVVRRIKTDDGCYKIDGADTAGHKIEVKIDPGTLAIVAMERDDDD